MTAFHIPDGLKVLVTAGGSGIGRVIADAFVQNGARVHICDIDAQALQAARDSSADISATKADVANPEDVARLFSDTLSALGGLDILVNNAGIAGPTAAIENIAIADWRRTLDVNLNGQFYCLRLAIPLLRQSRAGLIINISSIAGRLGYPFRSPYAASKWAVVGLIKSLAIELGDAGVRVNAILPGLTNGVRGQRVIVARAARAGRTPAAIEAEAVEHVSLKRLVDAEDIAATALFLASSAGRNITGQALSVCGDARML